MSQHIEANIADLNFEMKDIEVFRISDVKTRIATVQNYFFPRLEILMRSTLALIEDVYDVSPYEKMTFVYYPNNRRKSLESRDFDRVNIGLSGKRRTDRTLKFNRRDGKPFFFHPTYLTYNIYFDGSMRVELLPFRQYVSSNFINAVAKIYKDNYAALAKVFGLQQISHTRARSFVASKDAFVGNQEEIQENILFSPYFYFPVSSHRGLQHLMLSFVALYPLLDAFVALGEGERPQLKPMTSSFMAWYLKEGHVYDQEIKNIQEYQSQGENRQIDLPELDSYTFVRPGIWWSVLASDKWTCCSCGRSARENGVSLEVDHIVPRSRGGTNELTNLQTLCRKCNIGKSNKDSTDLRRPLQ